MCDYSQPAGPLVKIWGGKPLRFAALHAGEVSPNMAYRHPEGGDELVRPLTHTGHANQHLVQWDLIKFKKAPSEGVARQMTRAHQLKASSAFETRRQSALGDCQPPSHYKAIGFLAVTHLKISSDS